MSIQRKLLTILLLCAMCVLAGCGREHDHIQISNKNYFIFDDFHIPIEDGYFYDRHDKFKVDDNTVGVTIYFSKEKTWELIKIEEVEIKFTEQHSSV